MRGDEIKSQKIAEILFDGYVNMGANAVKLMQNLVGVKQDGQIGPATVAAINASDELELFEEYKEERKRFYVNLANRKPELQVFLKGWLNRMDSFHDFKK
jgi:type VI secretion system secreted protein VgrG